MTEPHPPEKSPVSLKLAPRQHCPHCSSYARARSSHPVSRISREITYQCQNVACGFCWVSVLSAIREISPPAVRHAEVELPRSYANQRKTP